MKLTLAGPSLLLLVITLSSCVLARDVIDCQTIFETCPEGYTLFRSGKTVRSSRCHCARPDTPEEKEAKRQQLCRNVVYACQRWDADYSYVSRPIYHSCSKALEVCDANIAHELCDRLKADNRKYQCLLAKGPSTSSGSTITVYKGRKKADSPSDLRQAFKDYADSTNITIVDNVKLLRPGEEAP